MVGTKDLQTSIHKVFFPSDFNELQEFINGYDCLLGHNIIDFDIVFLKKFLGISFDNHKIVDTLVMSRLYNPQLEKGHSLKSWGERLGFPKGDFND